MCIETTANELNLKVDLSYPVKSSTHLLSTGDETNQLCQKYNITIDNPINEVTLTRPARILIA